MGRGQAGTRYSEVLLSSKVILESKFYKTVATCTRTIIWLLIFKKLYEIPINQEECSANHFGQSSAFNFGQTITQIKQLGKLLKNVYYIGKENGLPKI